jgi:transglutaminase-like putative cysteine protease
MRVRICHETSYAYAPPATGVVQTLRLTPRNHDGQYVAAWRIDVSQNVRLHQHEDAFGNLVHTFSADGPLAAVNVLVEGEVETQDTSGTIGGTIERFPASLFLRETPLCAADEALRDFAARVRDEAGGGDLALLHRLLQHLHAEIAFDTNPTDVGTTAREAFALRRGVCQDFSHIFIAAARSLGIPARYIGGYFRRGDGVTSQDAGHAWAEAFVPDLGWIAFDPANGICGTDAHVRVAVGLDYLGAAPVRGARFGGGTETMAVKVHVDQAAVQVQN